MSCGIDDTLKLCIVPSDEEQLLGSTELQKHEAGANPARVNDTAAGEDKAISILSSKGMKSSPSKDDAPASLRSVPSDALHNLLLFCGPQSVTTGLGSTSKHYRSLCLTSGDSDVVWKAFCKWRCSSKLVFGNVPSSHNRSVADPREDDNDELMPSRATAERRREFQSSARLSSWNASSKSFENGKLSPDEPYYSIYRRLHLDGKKRENSAGIRCNRRRAVTVFQPNGEATIATAADGDPTLQELQAEMLQEFADWAADIHGTGRVCNSGAIEWCDSPSCRRGRCGKCLVPSMDLDARHFPTGRSAAGFLGNFTSKCDFCAITLCKFAHGCAENNLRRCDSCNRGVCLDCEHIVSNNPLGIVRTCKGRGGKCRRFVCWRCARTVGRSKTVEIENEDAGMERSFSSISKLSIDNIVEKDRKMSPSEASAMESGYESSRRSPVNDAKFEALPFSCEKQFVDATCQTLCDECAKEKVGKLNMYRRLDMSPRI